jgi:phospholipid-binding lipoprotein MlaA
MVATSIKPPIPAVLSWEGMNRDILSFNDQVDKFVLKPVAKGYQWITPEFVDTGISNFFSNLKDIGVSVNGFLQAKPKQGGMDTARFLVNSTAGIIPSQGSAGSG